MPQDLNPHATDTLSRLATLLLHGEIEVVDCSGTLGPDTPVESGPEVEIHKISEYDKDGPFFAWNWLVLGEQSGTHFETPKAWAPGPDGANIATDSLDINRCAAPACVIDCSEEIAADPGFLLTEARIRDWEKIHGEIPKGAWVLMRSDWADRAADKAAFLNDGIFPGPAPDAIRYLVTKGITGWGSECLSPDCGAAEHLDPPSPARHQLAAAGGFCLASLANLKHLPPTGATLLAAPLKFAGGNASPARVLALIPRGNHK